MITKLLLSLALLGITLGNLYQARVIAEQRTLIQRMAGEPGCMAAPTKAAPKGDSLRGDPRRAQRST